MISKLRKRVTYVNVAMTVALVFAMSGGAFAAGKYLITSTKQISPKVLASLKGKAGAAGKAGAVGPGGPAGAVGPAGPAGGQGPQGLEGKEGKQGEPGKEGKAGANGTTGFTETLPQGKTLKGDWGLFASVPGAGLEGVVSTAVGFSIPLTAAPTPHLIPAPTEAEENKGEFPTPPAGCTGNVTKPGAAPGNLCVFAREQANVAVPTGEKICATGEAGLPVACAFAGGTTPETADPSGFMVVASAEAKGLVRDVGTWAVTSAK